MLSESDTPGEQLVPAAMDKTADHWPDAQRWNEVPEMQFQAPSSVQAPFCAPVAVPADGVLELGGGVAGEAAGGVTAEEAGGVAEGVAGADDVTVCRVVGMGEAMKVLDAPESLLPPGPGLEPVLVVTKTPPAEVLLFVVEYMGCTVRAVGKWREVVEWEFPATGAESDVMKGEGIGGLAAEAGEEEEEEEEEERSTDEVPVAPPYAAWVAGGDAAESD